MKVENLPKVVKVRSKDKVCYQCGKKIPKGSDAVFHWWITPKSKAYDHFSCWIKTNKK